MSDTVIETSGLRKEFRTRKGRHVVAVADLDLAVPAGGVHGFLGPNGSGKTTTIRMLLGLARASRGEMRLFGEPVPERLPHVINRVGAVVEQPKFVPTFSGRKNLSLLARSIGVRGERVDSALAQVGLAGRDRERYKGYSLGMKQRLAIAATLLKSPDLLILDEPTNGLDPAGIRDIRDMIRGLGESGVTVLLSSHILAEVQQVCHSVSIIGNGRLLASGDVDALIGDGAGTTRVVVADPAGAERVLLEAGHQVTRAGEALQVEGVEDPAVVTRALAGRGMYLRELTQVRPDLESVFLHLTKDDTLAAGRAAPPLDGRASTTPSTTDGGAARRSTSSTPSPTDGGVS
jgi:ABC-2 type transport system ATP-binding protein